MGMGTFGCHATIVSEDFIKTLPTAGPALIHLRKLMSDYELKDDIFSYANHVDDFVGELEMALDSEEKAQEINNALKAVCECFNNDTGLTLDVNYHDQSNEGDRYDEVDGIYWSVGGVYVMTPQAEAIKEHIQTVMFTKWG